jgi:hypothetical protein
MVEILKIISESGELCPICHLYIHRGEQTKIVNGQECHINCYNKIKDKMEATPKWKRLFKSPGDYLQAESKNGSKKTVINLNEFSTAALTEEKKVLQEGLFKAFLAGVVGFLLGKRSNNLIIKGQKDQIDTLTKYLEKTRSSASEKDRLIDRLTTLQASSRSISDLKRQFKDETGISLP